MVEDVRIDGVHDGDRPFFVAKQLSVGLDWSQVVQRRPEFIITSVELTDWTMLVEKWDGGHNFIRLTSDQPPPTTPPAEQPMSTRTGRCSSSSAGRAAPNTST